MALHFIPDAKILILQLKNLKERQMEFFNGLIKMLQNLLLTTNEEQNIFNAGETIQNSKKRNLLGTHNQ